MFPPTTAPSLTPAAPVAGALDSRRSAAATVRLRIGVYDSGIGGLSVVPALARHLPDAQWLYVADSAYAPYGERPVAEIRARARHVTTFLKQAGAEALVMACNTATAAAADELRAAHPGWPIVGIEPAVKPAALHTRSGHVGVMATQATLASPRFQRLIDAHGSGMRVHVQACHGLAAAIEACPPDDARVRERLQHHLRPLLDAGCDVVVLGCTHYALVSGWIRELVGDGVTVLDTAEPVARRTAQLMQAAGRTAHAGPQSGLPASEASPLDLQAWTSGPTAQLDTLMQHWLGLRVQARPLPEA